METELVQVTEKKKLCKKCRRKDIFKNSPVPKHLQSSMRSARLVFVGVAIGMILSTFFSYKSHANFSYEDRTQYSIFS